jgi:transcription initiation factor TFIIIB Brf1 subunit/transcription initiation factor TFIIB
MDDEMWELFREIKNEEDKQNKISNGIDDNGAGEDIIKCKCGSMDYLIDDNMHICKKCSAIISKVIENTAEWRYYGNEDNRDGDPSRCGMPTNNLLPKSSIGSMIGSGYKDNIDMHIIRKFQMWNSMPYDERTLWNVFDKMTANTINNGIPQKVIDDAKNLYKQASEKKISRGDNKEGLIASCIYHACLINKIPKSSKDIAAMFGISHVTLNKGNTRFQTLLQLNVSSPNPIDFISQYGNNLNMSISDINKCKELVKLIEENEIMNDNSPTSSAAGILYYYSTVKGLGYSKKSFAKACNVSEVTIIKCYKLINIYNTFITTHKSNIFT